VGLGQHQDALLLVDCLGADRGSAVGAAWKQHVGQKVLAASLFVILTLAARWIFSTAHTPGQV